jgi:hypothetical protein
MIPVFLTTCSKNKVGGGLPYCNCPKRVTASGKILKLRNRLFDLLLQREKQRLRGAVQGLDFVNDSTADGVYLPARIRYARGQFMTSLEKELTEALDLWFSTNSLFFLSGLYGIVSALEPIQNYDIELAELAANYWKANRNSLTDSLIGLLKQGSILLDCCGDSRYSDLVDWKKIEENGYPVLHALDRQREGGQVRAEAGILAANINEERLKRIRDGEVFQGANADIKFVSNNEFLQPRTGSSGHFPLVGVIDTSNGEFLKVTKKAARQGWDKYFSFKIIRTPEALGRAYQNGMKQCICLIPPRAHSYLVDWCGGKLPKDVFDGELLKVKDLAKLNLRFSALP